MGNKPRIRRGHRCTILTYLSKTAVVLFPLLFSSCASNVPSEPGITPPPKSLYTIPPPTGKLPWPLHKPGFSQGEYDAMMNSLFIINNFGEYQAGETKDEVLFHDGIDIVVATNGTKLYAVDSGWVKDINTAVDGYKHIIIGDTEGAQPGKAWVYAHVDSFQYKVGEYVPQGAFIAVVRFIGLPHVHLNRGYLVSGTWANWENLSFVQPIGFFAYEDDDPPVIETPFYYLRNNSDSLFERGGPTKVSGDVDIVVGMRDAGAYAHSRDQNVADLGFGDRLCVSRIEYELIRQGTLTEKRVSFDFSQLICHFDANRFRRSLTVFKHRSVVGYFPTTSDKVYSYYIISNANPKGPPGDVKIEDKDFSWNTAARNEQGNPLYPDGPYGIRVTAYDSHGNSTSRIDTVLVKNNP